MLDVWLVISQASRHDAYFVQDCQDAITNNSHCFTIFNVEKGSAEIRFIEVVMKRYDKLLQIIDAKLRIEQVLSAMESAHRQDMFYRQRASLDLGFFNQTVISRQELVRILTADRRAGFSSPTVNWYYENIRVSPTSRTEHQLICRVRLLLTDSVSYETYYIWSWITQVTIMSKFWLPPT